MSKIFDSRWLPFALLGLLIVLLTAANVHRVRMQPHSFAGQDEEHHLVRGLLFHDTLFEGIGEFFDDSVTSWPSRWPPLLYISSAISMEFFGRSQSVMALTGTFFFALLILSIYLIGNHLANPRVGLLAAATTATWPYFFDYSRYYNLDMGLSACAALSVYLLLRSKGFTNRTFSIIFGICFGIGMLAKIVYPFFLLPPVIAVFALTGQNSETKARWINASLAGLCAVAISGFWYLPRIDDIFDTLIFHVIDYNSNFAPLTSESGEFFLTQGFHELGLFGSLVVIVAFACFPRKANRTLLPIYIWFALPILVSLLAPSDIARFSMAGLPAAPLLLLTAKWGAPKKLHLAALTLLSLAILVNLPGCFKIATKPHPWIFYSDSAHSAGESTPWIVTAELIALLPDKPEINVCYFQDFLTGPQKLGGDQFRFMFSIEDKRIRFAALTPFNVRHSNYEGFLRCMKSPDMIIVWTKSTTAFWPDSNALFATIAQAPTHSLSQEDRLEILGYPPKFDFSAFPGHARENFSQVYEGRVGFYQGEDATNRIIAFQ